MSGWRLNIYHRSPELSACSPKREEFTTRWAAENRFIYYKFKDDINIFRIYLQRTSDSSGVFYETVDTYYCPMLKPLSQKT